MNFRLGRRARSVETEKRDLVAAEVSKTDFLSQLSDMMGENISNDTREKLIEIANTAKENAVELPDARNIADTMADNIDKAVRELILAGKEIEVYSDIHTETSNLRESAENLLGNIGIDQIYTSEPRVDNPKNPKEKGYILKFYSVLILKKEIEELHKKLKKYPQREKEYIKDTLAGIINPFIKAFKNNDTITVEFSRKMASSWRIEEDCFFGEYTQHRIPTAWNTYSSCGTLSRKDFAAQAASGVVTVKDCKSSKCELRGTRAVLLKDLKIVK